MVFKGRGGIENELGVENIFDEGWTSMAPVRVWWRGWSNKGFNFEVCHDEVMISDVESKA